MADPQTVSIFDPDGVQRDIPIEHAREAIAAGGKPAVQFQGPDGKVRHIPVDQTQDALSSGGKLVPFERQDEGIKKWYGFTPSNVAKNVYEGAKGIVGGTYEVAKDLVNNPNWVQGNDSTFHKFIQAPADEQVAKASKALEQGDHSAAAGHILASALPLVGPWAAGLGEQAGKGDIGGAVGNAAGTVLAGSAGQKAGELATKAARVAVPASTALVKSGTGELVKAAGATLAPEPHELMTKALKPTAGNTGFDAAIKTAMPDLKAAEADLGKPVAGTNDLLQAVTAAKRKVWSEYQAKLDQAKSVDAGPLQVRDTQTGQLRPVTHEPTINGHEIADAMEASVTKRQAQLNPQLAEKVKAAAATYRKPMTLGDAEDFLQDANNELHGYYAKNKVGRRAAAADPEMASTVAEAEQLRDSLYSKLDELTGPGASEIKQRYGALSNIEEEALRRKNVAARQQPESLAEQVGKAAGFARAVGGTGLAAGSALTGHGAGVAAGLTLAGEGVMQAGLSKWLKGRQTTDAMITRAFADYGKPVSGLRAAITGERGEAGPPGSVQEPSEDELNARMRAATAAGGVDADATAQFQQARRELGPGASLSDVAQRAQEIKMRRTPADTRADVMRASASDPLLGQHEANMRNRAQEAQKTREALGPLTQPSDAPVSLEPGQKATSYYDRYGKIAAEKEVPNVDPFYSKAEKAAKMLPGAATGQQMLATLKNQGVKPGELEQLGIEKFLQSKTKFTADEVRDYIAKNKLQLGQKDLTPEGSSIKLRNIEGAPGATRYESYTLPGEKQNYTERLITLPEKFSEFGDDESNYGKNNFQSSHWDEPNVLAHARFDERTAADGKKVLFMEEAQSDWHQKGKKEGYKQGSYKALNPTVEEYTPGRYYISDPDGGQFLNRDGELEDVDHMINGGERPRTYPSREEAELNARDLVEHGRPKGGVPDAPFKSDWHELVVKNMLREAAERGADRLAWTTGDQQAERYDLSRYVGKLWYNEDSNQLLVFDKSGKNVQQHVDLSDNPGKLADYIGKDAADKLLSSPAQTQPDIKGKFHELSGLELKIGGEWAKALYDRAIPNFLNKYAKKWGAKVGQTQIGVSEGPNEGGRFKTIIEAMEPNEPGMVKYMKEHNIYSRDAGDTHNGGTNLELEGKPEDLRELLSKYWSLDEDDVNRFVPKVPPGGHTVHSIEITPAMKKALLKEGQPIASAATFDGPEKTA